MIFRKFFKKILPHRIKYFTWKNILHFHFTLAGILGLKSLLVKFFFSSALFLPFFSFGSLAGIESIEREHGVAETTMYTMVYTHELDQAFIKSCDESSLKTGNKRFVKVKSILNKKYTSKSDAWILNHSRNLYEKIRMSHGKNIDNLEDDLYCESKYVMYHTQQYLRDKHLEILKKTEIIEDFGGFGGEKIYGWETKRDVLDMKLKTLAPYIKKLGTKLLFKEKNAGFKNGLTGARKTLLKRSEKVMKLSLYKVLYDLKKRKVFTQKDIDILKDKTILEFADNCQVVNGRYDIKETLKSSGEHIKYETEALHLKVNLCGNFFIVRDIDKTYEKIITHELGHHFYYYHERLNHNTFEDICWLSNTIKNKKCSKDDFVSDYAKTAAVEDYAEHFMYRFLDIVPTDTKKIQTKNSYFKNNVNKE